MELFVDGCSTIHHVYYWRLLRANAYENCEIFVLAEPTELGHGSTARRRDRWYRVRGSGLVAGRELKMVAVNAMRRDVESGLGRFVADSEQRDASTVAIENCG
jgi:hypothetical protein